MILIFSLGVEVVLEGWVVRDRAREQLCNRRHPRVCVILIAENKKTVKLLQLCKPICALMGEEVVVQLAHFLDQLATTIQHASRRTDAFILCGNVCRQVQNVHRFRLSSSPKP